MTNKGEFMAVKSLYIVSQEAASGTLIVTMGMMELLRPHVGRVAFFRPIVESENDPDTAFILEHFGIDMPLHGTYGLLLDEAETLLAQNNAHALMERLITAFAELKKSYDFILCEGLASHRFPLGTSGDINLEIAKNLGVSIISVHSAKDKNAKSIAEEYTLESSAILAKGCSHFAAFINRGAPDTCPMIKERTTRPETPVFCLPETPELDAPTMGEVLTALRGELILGGEADLARVAKQTKVAAMQVGHFLERLEDGDLIITPWDRDDIILATLEANRSGDYPTLAGLVITGNTAPEAAIRKLISGMDPIPVIVVATDTYETAKAIDRVPARLHTKAKRKIALARGLFRQHADAEALIQRLALETPGIMTPVMFEHTLFERARSNRKRIVLPESDDERILRAAEILVRRDVADLVLLGNPEEVVRRASALGLDLSGIPIIDPKRSEKRDAYAAKLYEMRRHKGMKEEDARELVQDVSYFGTLMVASGDADGMVSGAAHTTQETVRPALQVIKTQPGISIVSSVFLMCMETEVLVFGDCAVNLDPTAEELAQIAVSSAQTATQFGVTPRVAMLSYSTGSSGQGADVEKVKEATRIAKELAPEIPIEGPIQYDAAVDADVAAKKLPGSHVAGQATVFIFPDLNTGNNTYKAVQRSSGAVAIGPVLQGLNAPVNDLSRGCLVDDIVNTVAITAIQAGV